ncbi:hypothetical protein KCP73_01495 [Salmonella enterica subsp. enterica]|nr:hypothetical protein KCP73_01495 [Salmonella enterica subsp. enterica]
MLKPACRICFDAHQRRKTPRRIHRLDAALSGSDGRQLPAAYVITLPARDSSILVPLHSKPVPASIPATHTAAQRVVEMLPPSARRVSSAVCAHSDQPVLVIVFVPVYVRRSYYHFFPMSAFPCQSRRICRSGYRYCISFRDAAFAYTCCCFR